MVAQSDPRTVRLIAGRHAGSRRTRHHLAPVKPVTFDVPSKLIKHSMVLHNMFKEGAFIEGITRTASFPELTGRVLANIVAFIGGRLQCIPDADQALELFLAAEYLQMKRLQRMCAKSIAKDFTRFQSFESLPNYLIPDILQELDPLQLCMAETILKKDRVLADTTALWKRLLEHLYPGSDSVPDARTFLIQHHFEKTISLYDPLSVSKPAVANHRRYNEPDRIDHLGLLRPSLTYMACHIQRFVLKNAGLNENILYAIISRLTSASELRLESNQLNPSAGVAVAHAIKQQRREMISLDISDNHISALGIRSLAACSNRGVPVLQALPSIQSDNRRCPKLSICLADNKIGDAFLVEMAGFIDNIQLLNLSRNKLGCQGAQVLASALSRMPKLTHLFMHSCQMDAVVVTAITEAILKTPIALVYFDISDNIDSTDRFYSGKLDQLIVSTPTLRHLRMGKNKFAPKSILSIAQALRSSSQIQTLDLQAIELECAIQTLALACQESKTIRSLNLANACLSSKSMVNIASVVAYSTSLKHLDISGNVIGDASEALGLALQENTILTSLTLNAGLGSNCLNSASLQGIVNGLQRSSSIKRLSLINHKMKNVDCISVIHLLSRCTSLVSIDLRGNQICDRGLHTVLHFVLEHRQALSREIVLDLRSTDLTLASESVLRSLSSLFPRVRILNDVSQYGRI